MSKEKQGFLEIKREFGRWSDYALRQVILVEKPSLGRHIGMGRYVTEVLLPNGFTVKDVLFDVQMNRELKEEFVFFEEPIGQYQGVIDDSVLATLRFKINFASD